MRFPRVRFPRTRRLAYRGISLRSIRRAITPLISVLSVNSVVKPSALSPAPQCYNPPPMKNLSRGTLIRGIAAYATKIMEGTLLL